MNQQSQFSDNQFLSLTECSSAKISSKKNEGNILHDVKIQPAAFTEISVFHNHHEEPSVVVTRDGEKIVSIEFRCICGQSKTINFDYEDE